ncbi:uncharacterized protein LOC134790897 [Cydia splendana]|uniref:uncharacterized protein LOC134790897 n=1 Tax=Cydia splendana TaxID=1100963 RepID=UPI0028F4A370
MSPLVRSLLALAALLAAADAQQQQCTTKYVGQQTNHPVPINSVHVPYPGATVTIYGEACGPYRKPVGEKIVCCNSSPYSYYIPPEIVGPAYPPNLSPFDVHCQDPAGCDCHITQYCPDYKI